MTTVHIMTATLTLGDAIGNYSRMLQRLLFRAGYRIRLYADLWDKDSVCLHSREFENSVQPDDILWYHYSIYSDNLHIVTDKKCFTVLDYHGITPPELFRGYSSHLENLCIKGREFAPRLIDVVDCAICHSNYTGNELEEFGYKNIVKIPLAVETSRFSIPEKTSLSEYLAKLHYLLFVGRITPQKSILEVLDGFKRLHDIRNNLLLFLVGEYSYSKQYVEEIRSKIAESGLEDAVILTDRINDVAALKSFYKHAFFSVYLSHWETFCVPIVESMYLRTPVIGLNKTAIPEVLGNGGILLDSHDPMEFEKKVLPYLEDENMYHDLQSKSKEQADRYTEAVLGDNINREILPRFGVKCPKPRIAFVVQRYGLDVYGGAEHLCRLMAERLAQHVEVEVLTTCAVDYHSWENVYKPGLDRINGVTVRRFPVFRERDMERFTNESETLFEQGVRNISFNDGMDWMREQGPRSPELLRYLKGEKERYEFFLFYTYLYASTFLGLSLVRDKAILVPTAHNEPPIYVRIFHELFQQPRGILYLTEAERNFILRLFRNHHIPSAVAGVGIDKPETVDALAFREKFGISGPFILYVGRIARSKGCQELFDKFRSFKKQSGLPHRLVLVGKEMMSVPEDPSMLSLGFLSNEDKWNAMAASDCVVNPSTFESLSFSVLEAWSLQKPTLVNGRCDVLADHTLRSGGGLIYRDEKDFILTLEQILSHPDEMSRMGLRGYRYVTAHYSWEQVENICLDFLSELHNPTKRIIAT